MVSEGVEFNNVVVGGGVVQKEHVGKKGNGHNGSGNENRHIGRGNNGNGHSLNSKAQHGNNNNKHNNSI